MAEHGSVEEHVPGKRFYAVFALVAAALLLVGFYVSFTHEWNDSGDAMVWLWLLGFFVGVIIGPYAIQYAILRRFGARPRRRKWGSNWDLLVPHLVYWWEIGGHKLTGRRFAAAYAAPALLVCAVVLAYVVRFPTIAPIMGFILPVYLGNFWFSLLALRRPEGTLVENFGRGIRFYETSDHGVLDSRL